ncbi:MAG: transglutaminase-like domain-containing protein [Thermoguttaceae bacterium]|jgi:hypothetical protein
MSIKSLHIAAGIPFGLSVLLFLSGCGRSTPAAAPAPAASPASPQQASPLADRETWDIYRIRDARIGYGRTTVRDVEDHGRRLLKIDGLVHLTVSRYGQPTEQEIRCQSTETLDGDLVDFRSEIRQGPTPAVTVGRVVGDHLQMEMTTEGKKMSGSISWSSDCRGPFGMEETLLRRPMKPGERRTFRALDPSNQVTEVEMTAADYEQTPLLAGTFDLLKIQCLMRLPDGQKLRETIWADRAGETLKVRPETLGIEILRAPKEVALAKIDLKDFDLGRAIRVKVDRPVPSAHGSKRVCYRVRLDDGNPAEAFCSTASQRVKPIDPHTAEVTVYAIRPGQGGNPDAPADPPTEADKAANNFLQSDDPQIVADAREAAGAQSDPWQVALALERFVHKAIVHKDFNQAFATAAEVARTREGDCTEHAVYLAALARARGIPARVAVGLLYMPQTQTFDYHMWTQVFVEHRWIPLDATLALGGIGGGHLEVAHSNMQGLSAYSTLLPVVQVVGRLHVEVLSAE